jgi:xylulokinase
VAIIRAVMEGVAYSLKDTFTIFEEMEPVTSIRLGGGGARSPLWRQIQADAYAHEVEIVAAEEGAAYGAAILAGTGAGAWSSVDEACDKVVRVASRIAPDRSAAKTMKRGYRKFRKIYPALRRVLK